MTNQAPTTTTLAAAIVVVVVLCGCTHTASAQNFSSSSQLFHITNFAGTIYDGIWGTLRFPVKLGANVNNESPTSGTRGCSPIFYPGGFMMAGYVPPAAGTLPGNRADDAITFEFMHVYYPGTDEFNKFAEDEIPVVKGSERESGVLFHVPANYGGAACVYYEGEETLEFDVFVSVGPSLQGNRNMNAVTGVAAFLVAVFVTRVYFGWSIEDGQEPATSVYEMFVSATYFPSLDLPKRHLYIVELIAFCGGLMLCFIKPTNDYDVYLGGSPEWGYARFSSLETVGNDYVLAEQMPLSLGASLGILFAAPVFQLFVGFLCAVLAKYRNTYPHVSKVVYVVYFLLFAIEVTFVFLLFTPAYDYRMQARSIRFAISFGGQMLIWMLIVRPILSRFTLIEADKSLGGDGAAKAQA